MTNSANQTILNKLNEVFSPFDEKVKAASIEWILERQKEATAFCRSDEYKNTVGIEQFRAKREKLEMLAGGKKWLNVIFHDESDLIEIMIKNCDSIVSKRNKGILDKLVKADVTEVISENFTLSDDGFNGAFSVNTNKGVKTVSISTVLAGGYNIQCLHNRVLVKIK